MRLAFFNMHALFSLLKNTENRMLVCGLTCRDTRSWFLQSLEHSDTPPWESSNGCLAVKLPMTKGHRLAHGLSICDPA